MALLLIAVMSSCRDTSKTSADTTDTRAQIEDVKKDVQKQSMESVDSLPEAPSTPVLDMAHVLSPSEVTEITQDIVELDSLKLAQVAVVTVNDLQGKEAHAYATALANKWGVGHKEANDGITILIKPKTDDTPAGKGQVAIATGLGMEKILTNAMCQRIINEKMVPEFKQNRYGEAIEEAIDEIKDILTGDKD